jgi:hypothetical protein
VPSNRLNARNLAWTFIAFQGFEYNLAQVKVDACRLRWEILTGGTRPMQNQPSCGFVEWKPGNG